LLLGHAFEGGRSVHPLSRRLIAALAVVAGMASASRAQTPAPATMPLTTQAAPCPSLPPGLSDATAMLGHIEDVLNEALGRSPAAQAALQKDAPKTVGTSGGVSMLVGIERDKFDQIRAEIAQLKSILKK
jgi:hypothetical protein